MGKLKLNTRTIREQLLKSDEILAICQEIANDIVQKCGDGYETDTHKGKNRINVSIYASSKEAIQNNLDNNTLIKAIHK